MGLLNSVCSRVSSRTIMSSEDTDAVTQVSSSARNQVEDAPDSPPSTDDESFARLLGYLIRRDSYRSDNEEESTNDSKDLRRDNVPTVAADTSTDQDVVAKNELLSSVSLTSGQIQAKHACFGRAKNPVSMMRKREYGLPYTTTFSAGDRCCINNNFLPNRMRKVAKYRSKGFCGQFARDGTLFVSSCQDQRIRFYDVSSGGRFKEFHSIEARDVGWSVVDTTISPDGNHVIYSSWSDYIHQCNIFGDMEHHVAFNLMPREPRFCAFSLRFSADGNEILVGASDRCLYIYDRDRNARILKIRAHEDDVNAVCFADNSSHILYSGGDDGVCKVWDRRTLNEERPSPVGTLAGHMDGITYIDTKDDARYLISNSKDQSIKLWDLRRFSSSHALENSRKAVSSQNWDYRWQSVPRKVLTMKSHRRLEGDSSVITYYGHTVLHTLIRCFFSPSFCTGQRYIYSGCASGACYVYDLLTGSVVKKLRAHKSCVRDVSWHPYENVICTTSWDGVLGSWTYCGRRAAGSAGPSDSDSDSDLDENIHARRRRHSVSTAITNNRRRNRRMGNTGVSVETRFADDADEIVN